MASSRALDASGLAAPIVATIAVVGVLIAATGVVPIVRGAAEG